MLAFFSDVVTSWHPQQQTGGAERYDYRAAGVGQEVVLRGHVDEVVERVGTGLKTSANVLLSASFLKGQREHPKEEQGPNYHDPADTFRTDGIVVK